MFLHFGGSLDSENRTKSYIVTPEGSVYADLTKNSPPLASVSRIPTGYSHCDSTNQHVAKNRRNLFQSFRYLDEIPVGIYKLRSFQPPPPHPRITTQQQSVVTRQNVGVQTSEDEIINPIVRDSCQEPSYNSHPSADYVVLPSSIMQMNTSNAYSMMRTLVTSSGPQAARNPFNMLLRFLLLVTFIMAFSVLLMYIEGTHLHNIFRNNQEQLRNEQVKFMNQFKCVSGKGINGLFELLEAKDFQVASVKIEKWNDSLSLSENDAALKALYELQKFRKFNLASSVLFVVSVITTVGYGYNVPVTQTGRLLCCILPIFGVPVCLKFSAMLVDYIMSYVREVYTHRVLTLTQFIQRRFYGQDFSNDSEEDYLEHPAHSVVIHQNNNITPSDQRQLDNSLEISDQEAENEYSGLLNSGHITLMSIKSEPALSNSSRVDKTRMLDRAVHSHSVKYEGTLSGGLSYSSHSSSSMDDREDLEDDQSTRSQSPAMQLTPSSYNSQHIINSNNDPWKSGRPRLRRIKTISSSLDPISELVVNDHNQHNDLDSDDGMIGLTDASYEAMNSFHVGQSYQSSQTLPHDSHLVNVYKSLAEHPEHPNGAKVNTKLLKSVVEAHHRSVMVISKLLTFSCLLVCIVLLCIVMPTMVFCLVEAKWSVIDSLYFSLISMATVGLGDLVPFQEIKDDAISNTLNILLSAYLIFGTILFMVLLRTYHESYAYIDPMIQRFRESKAGLEENNKSHP